MLEILERALGPDDPNVAAVLGNLATLYSLQGQYERADPLYLRALKLREAALGPDHPDVATSLNNLAAHYRDQARYDEAEPLYERALKIGEAAFGADHPNVARSLNNLASLYFSQGRYDAAVPLYRRALAIREAALGAEDPAVANTLNNLATTLDALGRYDEAEPLLQRALAIREAALGPDHPDVAQSLNNLAFLYDTQGRYAESEALYKRSLAINEAVLGPDHHLVAGGLNNLAALYVFLGRFAEAEPLYERALAIRRKVLGDGHPDTAQSLNNLALLFDSQGRFAEAEATYRESLRVWQAAVGPDHPEVAAVVNNLAALYGVQGRFAEAEPLYARSLAIREAALGLDHPDVGTALHNLAGFYDGQARYADAEPLYRRALEIMEAALGPDHPRVATSLNNLATLYRLTGRSDAALPLFERALAIREAALGADHRDVAESLNNIAVVHENRGDFAAAEPFYRRALAAAEAALGPDHPDVGTALNNLASLHDHLGRDAAAEALYRRALAIRRQALGPGHRDVAVALNNLAALLRKQGRVAEALAEIRAATDILAGLADLEAGRRGGENLAAARANRFGFLRHVRLAGLMIADAPDRRDALTAEAFRIGQRARASGTARAVANMAARFAAGDDALAGLVRDRQDLANRLRALETALVKAVGRPPKQRDAAAEADLRAAVADASGRLVDLDARLADDFPKYVEIASPRPVDLAAARALLRPDEALLSWLVGEAETFLFVLRADRAALFSLDIGKAALDAAVADLRAGLDPTDLTIASFADIPPFDTTAAHDLYRAIFAPAEDLLADARHVFVVPDGGLQSLPLGVLVTGAPESPGAPGAPIEDFAGYQDVPWLARRYAVTVLPSVSALRALRTFAAAARASAPFVGIGDPSFQGKQDGDTRGASGGATRGASGGIDVAALYRGDLADVGALRRLPPLPDTADELRAMAATLDAAAAPLLLGDAATETNVRNADLASARVVAFATHGLVAGDIAGATEPALVLTPPAVASARDDGLLTASEIARHLTLDADWVILSACNTAAGEVPGAEGLSGLAKAFFYAGSRALLVSHWPVASAATTRLTTRAFEIAAADPSLGRAEAFRRSMLDLMAAADRPHFAHPMFWAPFVVVGEGGAAAGG